MPDEEIITGMDCLPLQVHTFYDDEPADDFPEEDDQDLDQLESLVRWLHSTLTDMNLRLHWVISFGLNHL